MSYCVNCGVELDTSEKICPLCGVEVINPHKPYDEKAIRPYPTRLDPINERINRHFIATILTICIAFPAVICVAINLFMSGRADWSLYVAGALAMVWVFIVPYYLYRKPSFGWMFLPDIVAILLYLLLIAGLTPGVDWYMALGLPLTLLTGGLVLLIGLLIEHKMLRDFAIPAAILIGAGLLTVGTELIVELFIQGRFHLDWSFFVLIPCLALAAVFLTVARRQAIREEIRKRLHI